MTDAVKDVILGLDKIARDVDHHEYGLPIFTDGAMEQMAAVVERDSTRLREALTWAVGFIQCNYPKTVAPYPDYRNACDLLAEVGQVITGEFQMTVARAEVAEHERDRLRAALEMLAQVRHVSGSAQGAFRTNLRLVDAALAGADVRDRREVAAIAAGTWKPTT